MTTKRHLPRRDFIKATAASGTGAALARGGVAAMLGAATAPQVLAGEADRAAILGGPPAHTGEVADWPVQGESEESLLKEVLRSGRWTRNGGKKVAQFEEAFAKLTGAKHCLAVANGTSALFASLGAMEVGPGDEVILPPYTFVATLNAVLLHHALPVFVDTDLQSFQIDARKIEAAVTKSTAALMPVHLGGNVAEVDYILDVAERRGVPVVEDACQAPLAEWRGRKVGTFGRTGCFSFQGSKNLNAGEGGAVLTNDDRLAERLYAFHNNNRGRGVSGHAFSYQGTRGANLRITEWQAAILLAQMERLEEQSRTRERNAHYLTSRLSSISGIYPARTFTGCTRNAYHLYMFRFVGEEFGGALTRDKFVKALTAEGVPCSPGYSPLNREAFLKTVLNSKAYQRIYPVQTLIDWEARNRCPSNDLLCQQAVWLTHPTLLGPGRHMDNIATAIAKIRRQASRIARM